MKILKLKFLVLLVASVSLFTGCKDDEGDAVSHFVGNYVISKAVVAETFMITTTGLGQIPVPVGQEITAVIQASLLSQVNCSSADKSWVELRKDMSIYMSCEGANVLNAGTWEEISETELKLNLNSTAIPSSPTGFVLTVTDVSIVGSILSGNTSVPLTKDMVSAMVAPLTLTDANPDIFLVKFSIQFNKK